MELPEPTRPGQNPPANPRNAAIAGVGDKGPVGMGLRQEDGMLVGIDHPVFKSGPGGRPDADVGAFDFVDPALPQGRPVGAQWDDPRQRILPGDLGERGMPPKRRAGQKPNDPFLFYQ